MTITNHSMGAL